MGTPAAEVHIDAAGVRQLLHEQHPDLATLSLTEACSGWDNALFRLGDTLAVRLPRRGAAAVLVTHEQRWLPQLAPHLPLPVPAPVRVGRPGASYPWSWSVVPWLDGEPADRAPPDAEQGGTLADFLRALHVPAPADAPRNPYRGVPLATRATAFRARLDRIRGHAGIDITYLDTLWDDACAAPATSAETWIHGDLHPRNVLVRDGTLSGVIDWGDLARGDPATDLAAVWLLLPSADARRDAIRSLGERDAGAWRRARGWAALLAVMLLSAGLADDPRMVAIGEATLQRLRADGGGPG